MVAVGRFVDKIDAAPTTRLDVNLAPWTWLADDTELSPPRLRRALSDGGVLRHGSEVTAEAYENREMVLHLRLEAADNDERDAELQKLYRELDRDRNLFMTIPDGGTEKTFWRMWRSDSNLDVNIRSVGKFHAHVILPMLCDPFGYGLMQTAVNNADVDNNPASVAGEPMVLDIAAADVLGDTPTPAWLALRHGGGTERIITIAQRSRGTPSALEWIQQAEDGFQGTDTSVQANDAAMSGAGSNFSRCTFATVNALSDTRVQITNTGGFATGTFMDPDEGRGTYRIYARLRRNAGASTDDFEVRMLVNEEFGGIQSGDVITITNMSTSPILVDLGQFEIGPSKPLFRGYASFLPLQIAGYELHLQARRTAGTGNLDIDYFMCLPVDESFAQLDHSSNAEDMVFDGPNDEMYFGDSAVASLYVPERIGRAPLLVPNQDNRLYLKMTDATSPHPFDVLTYQVGVDVVYWPRYLFASVP